ncbi:MAG: hypothetical protein ACRELC_09400 [Gemmatimonadota bacterium]
MRSNWLVSIAAVALALACEETPTETSSPAVRASGGSERASEVRSNPVFRFEELVGVPAPFTGSTNPIRGVDGGGLPWVIEQGEARLDVNGLLRVKVEGLVLDPNDPAVIAAGVAGNNPVPQFKAILSCLTVSGGAAATVNVESGLVPATTGVGGGDAEIREQLAGIPDPCIAPIVFVTAPSGAWFAASGF